MTASELAQWMAFYQLEPFGDTIHDLRHGQQMALACNIKRDTKAHPAPFTAAEFMITPPHRAQTEETEETAEQISARISTELFGM